MSAGRGWGLQLQQQHFVLRTLLFRNVNHVSRFGLLHIIPHQRCLQVSSAHCFLLAPAGRMGSNERGCEQDLAGS